eukprot:c19722_g1_i1.p1 GENE.c19722_g1_i1~~c19722_g1_i1.p1  ORF type:complete len:367 (-),score=143.00 c19722_g1_i1:30-1130(-)
MHRLSLRIPKHITRSSIPRASQLIGGSSVCGGSLNNFSTFNVVSRSFSTTSTENKSTIEGEVVEPETTETTTETTTDQTVNEKKKFLEETEHVVGASEERTFEAETSKLLEIVANSIYTDKEVFLRELISNSSDALSKLRYFSTTEAGQGMDPGELKIEVAGDEELKTLTISDSGIGMSKAELRENLGTIARSGSQAFVKELQETGKSAEAMESIIGRFGVGFYSAFMVGKHVRVYSKKVGEEKGHCWESDGSGRYKLSEAEGVQRGTKIVIQLRKEAETYASKNFIKTIVEKYSNFVPYNIYVHGERCNKIEAIWLKDPKSVTQEQHAEFYKFIAHAYDQPKYTLMYKADVPVSIKSVFYIPEVI